MRQGAEIIVACPGRLLDHVRQRTVDLTKIEVLVLDEADQMFDMGFLPNIRKILQCLPKKRQTLLFSATMPEEVHELANHILNKPVKIKIGNTAPVASVKQVFFPVSPRRKAELLIHILHQTDKESVLVFTRTKHTAKDVSLKLESAGFRSASLQGNLTQSRRQSVMADFRSGRCQVLVATDIASRGIDVASISHVINYDIPSTVEAYIHRIGRTGRAEKEGEAFTLICQEDQSQVRSIERVTKMKTEQRKFTDFDYGAAAPARTLFSAATKKPSQRKERSYISKGRAQTSDQENEKRPRKFNRDDERRPRSSSQNGESRARTFSRDDESRSRPRSSHREDEGRTRTFSRRDEGGDKPRTRAFSRDTEARTSNRNGGESRGKARTFGRDDERRSRTTTHRDDEARTRTFSRDGAGSKARTFSRDGEGNTRTVGRDGESRARTFNRDSEGKARTFKFKRDGEGKSRAFSRDGETRSRTSSRDNDTRTRTFSRDSKDGTRTSKTMGRGVKTRKPSGRAFG
ncbi:MAG: hypothetical protein A3F43_00570 [Gammaproteobacteria bacterium RIFCSPHIGHO2_12_FULL_42_10]|nr:MAG: hypothetical protein A3F43_00570 [Gammaproteobacteria bacterium RIFCSPHIGHO2_12_FULL_42_10]